MIPITSPENAADIATLKTMLADLPIGETLSYAAMDAALDRPVRARRHILGRAVAECEEDTGGLFSCVRGAGVKRLESSAVPDVGLDGIRKVRRAARRAHERLANVRVNDLPEDARIRLIAHQSMLGAISMIADGRKAPVLSAEIRQTSHAVPAGRVLDLFKGDAK